MHVRTERIRTANRWIFVLLLVVACTGVFASALPQWRKLEAMQAQLERTRQREVAVMEERDVLVIEQRALREDPGFLELRARDRLDYYRDGERVYRIDRPR